MPDTQVSTQPPHPLYPRKVAIGIFAVFLTQFISYLFINARNIAIPVIINQLDGMQLFSWLIALPAVAGAASTLLFGKLSDIFGRRTILLLSNILFILGLGISTRITSMAQLVAAATFMSIGHFPIIPLCFTAIGDLFPPSDRAKWTGLLNLPGGVAALIGPVLGGLLAQSHIGWQSIYWGTIPLMLIASIFVYSGLPAQTSHNLPKIDLFGTLIMIGATTTLFIGFSWLGTPEKILWAIFLLGISLICWTLFVHIEHKAEAPILDPQLFRSRTFMTAAGAGFLSYFGFLAIASYSPIFVQNVMKLSPAISGSMLTPYSMILAFMGIPAGLILAKTKKFKGLYIISYSIATISLLIIWQFQQTTPVWLYILITSFASFGLGSLGTINTLVAQFAVPSRLLGVAVGAIFFFQMVGICVAPAILGLALNQAADLQSGLKWVFLISALTMFAALILISTIPRISMETEESR